MAFVEQGRGPGWCGGEGTPRVQSWAEAEMPVRGQRAGRWNASLEFKPLDSAGDIRLRIGLNAVRLGLCGEGRGPRTKLWDTSTLPND